MRNPINAILGMNLKLKTLIMELYEFIEDEIGILSNHKFDTLRQDIDESIYVQEQASKLLNFYVSDILCMS